MPYITMSRLALKWAFRKPVTSRYPFEPRQPIPGSRGRLVKNSLAPVCLQPKMQA